jgi:hypothetical protein
MRSETYTFAALTQDHFALGDRVTDTGETWRGDRCHMKPPRCEFMRYDNKRCPNFATYRRLDEDRNLCARHALAYSDFMNTIVFSKETVFREFADIPKEQESADLGEEPNNHQYVDWYKCSAVERMPGRCGGALTLRASRFPMSLVFSDIGTAGLDALCFQYGLTLEDHHQIETVLQFLVDSCGEDPALLERGTSCTADGTCPPIIPNAETIAAMEEARRGGLESITLDELKAELNAED